MLYKIHSRQDRYLTYLYFLFSLIYLSLVLQLPLSLYSNAVYDDALFSKLGEYIASGQWLGPFNDLTFAKGPGFPLFLAFNSFLGLPITLALGLIYLFSCIVICSQFRNLRINKILIFVVFLILLFHPYLMSYRILREDLYPSLVILLVSAVISILSTKSVRWWQMAGYGFLCGLFWITREEGIWIAPGISLVLLLRFVTLFRNKQSTKSLRQSSLTFLGSAIFFVAAISLLNYSKYGIFAITDSKGSEFSKTLDLLNSVNVGPEIPYIPVPKAKREAVYEVSPSFSLLREYFENPENGWKMAGCSIYPHSCGEYAGGWFMWALRSGANHLGVYQSATIASDYYKKINREIEKACIDGTLKCNTRIFPLIPRVEVNQWSLFPKEVWEILKLTLSISPVGVSGGPSNENGINSLRFFLGNPMTTMTRREEQFQAPTTLEGWYSFAEADFYWIYLRCNGEEGYQTTIARMPSPDIALAYKDVRARDNRFKINLSTSQAKECWLVGGQRPSEYWFLEADKEFEGLSVSTIMSAFPAQRDFTVPGGGFLHVDKITAQDPLKMYKRPIKIKEFLIKIYGYVIPVMVIFGLIAFLFEWMSVLMSKKKLTNLLLIATLCWILLITRTLILTMVALTSFPVASQNYVSAGFALSVLASMISLGCINLNRMSFNSSKVKHC